MSEQLELLDTRPRYTGFEKDIDWDRVSGMDLATNERLLSRWIHSPERRRQEEQMRRWSREIKRRNRRAQG